MQSTIETWNFWHSTVGWARPGNGIWLYENFPKRSLRKGSRLTTIRPTGQHGLPIRFSVGELVILALVLSFALDVIGLGTGRLSAQARSSFYR